MTSKSSEKGSAKGQLSENQQCNSVGGRVRQVRNVALRLRRPFISWGRRREGGCRGTPPAPHCLAPSPEAWGALGSLPRSTAPSGKWMLSLRPPDERTPSPQPTPHGRAAPSPPSPVARWKCAGSLLGVGTRPCRDSSSVKATGETKRRQGEAGTKTRPSSGGGHSYSRDYRNREGGAE